MIQNIKRFRFQNADICRFHCVDFICVLSFSSFLAHCLIIFFVYPPVSTLYYAGHPLDGYIISGNINPIVDAQRRWSVTSMCESLNITCATIPVESVNDPRVWNCLANLSVVEQNRCGRLAAHETVLAEISKRANDGYVSVFDDFVQLNDLILPSDISTYITETNLTAEMPLRHYGGHAGDVSSAYMIRPSYAMYLLSLDQLDSLPRVDMDITIGRDTLCPNGNERGIVCTYPKVSSESEP